MNTTYTVNTISDSVASSLYAALDPSKSTEQNAASQALGDLSTALHSGNPAAAQTALSSLQKALGLRSAAAAQTSPKPTDTANPSTSPFGSNSKANADYTNLVNAVNSGNTTDAQAALANLQTDLKARHGTGHHGHGAPPATQVSTIDTTPTSDATSSTSGNYVNVTV